MWEKGGIIYALYRSIQRTHHGLLYDGFFLLPSCGRLLKILCLFGCLVQSFQNEQRKNNTGQQNYDTD